MVWIPRYRYKVLVKGVDEYLVKRMDEIRKTYPEIEYVQRNIQPDHVHLVLSFPPKYSIARIVQIIKSNTGKAMWEKFEFLRKRYYGRGGIWSAGYFVSTVGLDEKLIEKYVQYQEKEDLGQAKLALD
jgi:putative transposase